MSAAAASTVALSSALVVAFVAGMMCAALHYRRRIDLLDGRAELLEAREQLLDFRTDAVMHGGPPRLVDDIESVHDLARMTVRQALVALAVAGARREQERRDFVTFMTRWSRPWTTTTSGSVRVA